jgi:predicted nucleic acid-binding protein
VIESTQQSGFVLDASAILEYLTDVRDRRSAIKPILEGPDTHCLTLEFCDLEVLAAVRAMVLRGDVSVSRAVRSVKTYHDLPLTRHGHGPLLPRIWELRANFSPYDAAYVVLAEVLDAKLVTADDRLRLAARTHTRLDVVPER